jgi:hypothetical protein
MSSQYKADGDADFERQDQQDELPHEGGGIAELRNNELVVNTKGHPKMHFPSIWNRQRCVRPDAILRNTKQSGSVNNHQI